MFNATQTTDQGKVRTLFLPSIFFSIFGELKHKQKVALRLEISS